MAMPKAAVNKNDLTTAWKRYIGLSGQSSVVKAVPIPCPPQNPPDAQLWAGMSRPDGLHNPSSLFFCSGIQFRLSSEGAPYPTNIHAREAQKAE
jgi:hypothetical protein